MATPQFTVRSPHNHNQIYLKTGNSTSGRREYELKKNIEKCCTNAANFKHGKGEGKPCPKEFQTMKLSSGQRQIPLIVTISVTIKLAPRSRIGIRMDRDWAFGLGLGSGIASGIEAKCWQQLAAEGVDLGQL